MTGVENGLAVAGSVAEWVAEVVTRSKRDEQTVRAVLARYGIRPQPTLPRPHQITVTLVSFRGVRPPAAGTTNATDEQFSFKWTLGTGVWCLASLGKNEAGKSSILEVILWCLRGRSGLQADVRHWLRQVRVEFTLDGGPLRVDMLIKDGRPTGQVLDVDTGTALLGFSGLEDFEQAMDSFMQERLGLERLRTVQKSSLGAGAPLVTGELSWPAYASALHIDRSGLKALLGGGNLEHALPTRLLELFLGAPWASTMVAAKVAGRQVAGELAAARARAEGDATARMAKLKELEEQLNEARRALAGLKQPEQAVTDLATLYEGLTTATRRAAQAHAALAGLERQHTDLSEQRRVVAAELTAAKEAALARAFFHTLMPTVCPRCDTRVEPDRWRREHTGHCSLCDSQLADQPQQAVQPPTEPTVGDGEVDPDELSDVDTNQAMFADIDAALDTVIHRLAQARSEYTAATAAQAEATAQLNAALADTQAFAGRDAELQVAMLEGAVAERRGRFADLDAAVDIAPLQDAAVVLKEVEKASHLRRTAALRHVLDAVGAEITELGRALGLDMLDRAELGSGATLTIYKGGQKQAYSSLTEGEQLRLKIITTIALLRHGFTSGVGRHPGLLLVDSPGAEEVDPGDLQRMLRELVSLAESIPQMQVIVATARGAEMGGIFPAERLRLAGEGQRLW